MSALRFSISVTKPVSPVSLPAGSPLGVSAFVIGGAFLVLEGVPGHAPIGADVVGSVIAWLSLGAFGSGLLLAPPRRPLLRPGLPVATWAAAVAAVTACLLLATRSMQTPLHGILSWFGLTAIVAGLGRQFHVRELGKLTLLMTTAYLVLGIAREIVVGLFEPQHGDYRFTGMFSPDVQGIYCALLVLSALPLLRHARSMLPLYVGLVAAGLLFLLLTRSTASCEAFLVAVLVMLFLQPVGGRRTANPWWFRPLGVLALMVLCVWSVRSVDRWPAPISPVGVTCLLIVVAGYFHAWRRFQRTDEESYRTLAAQLMVAVIHAQVHGNWEVSLCTALAAASVVSMSLTPLIGPAPAPTTAFATDPVRVPA